MPKSSKRKREDPDNPFWTREMMLSAKPLSEMPESLQRLAASQRLDASQKRGPQKAPTKVLTSIRLSQDVLQGLKATGPGWQSRADEALREWIQSPKRSKAA